MTSEKQPFGVRLDARTVERLDAVAATHGRKRAWAVAEAIARGLPHLEGGPVPSVTRVHLGADGTLDVEGLARALSDLLRADLVDAVASTRVSRSEAGEGEAPRSGEDTTHARAAPALAAALKSARESRGTREGRPMTQHDAAKAAGVSLPTFQRAEAGKGAGPRSRELLESWLRG